MKKCCELCKGWARMHCESDQASLCWDCDAKVHSANFLVARHSRNILCCACQSPTPWSACGSKLNPTVCFCTECVCGGESNEEEEVEEESDNEAEEETILPWSPPPPLLESSSSDDEEVSSIRRFI